MSTITFQEKWIQGLDTLRGIAIVRVLFFHMSQSYYRSLTGFNNETKQLVFSENFPPLLHFFNELHLGVNLFFSVSGYLIHRIYSKKDFTASYSGYFLGKRMLRVLPPYYISIVIAIVGGLILSRTTDIPNTLSHLLFIQNFWDDYSFGIQAIYWSIAVEVQFYLLYVLFRYLQSRFDLNISLLNLFIGVTLLGLVLKIVNYASGEDLMLLKMRSIDNTLMRFPEWLLGALTYEYRHLLSKIKFRLLFFTAVVLVAVALGHYFVFSYFLSDLCYAFGFCFLISYMIEKEIHWKALDFLGKISYSLYLYHFLIYSIWDVGWTRLLGLERSPSWERLLIMLLSVPVTIYGSYLMYQYVEKPLLNLQKKKSIKFSEIKS